MKIVDKAGRIFEMIDNIMAYLVGLLVVFIGAATLYEVCLLKVFRSPSLWAFEIVENAMLFLTFLGATWLLRQEGHVAMDIVVNRFPVKTQHAITAATSVLCA